VIIGTEARGKSEPIATIGDPPTKHAYWNDGEQGPCEGENQIGNQSKRAKGKPEDLALHSLILARPSCTFDGRLADAC